MACCSGLWESTCGCRSEKKHSCRAKKHVRIAKKHSYPEQISMFAVQRSILAVQRCIKMGDLLGHKATGGVSTLNSPQNYAKGVYICAGPTPAVQNNFWSHPWKCSHLLKPSNPYGEQRSQCLPRVVIPILQSTETHELSMGTFIG